MTARGIKLMAHGALKEEVLATVALEEAVAAVKPISIERIEAEA